MMRLLRTRRWQGFTALVIVAIVGFGLLSAWQWSRAEERRLERIALVTAAEADPVDAGGSLASLADLGDEVAAGSEWRPVRVVGTYVPDSTVLVRQRPLEGRNGLWVMTALRGADGATVWVNRGWIPAGASAAGTVEAPAAPVGQVDLTARVRAAESAPGERPGDLPADQVTHADPAEMTALAAERGADLTGADGAELASVVLERVGSDPGDPRVQALPLPVIDEGRNISYAVQWLIFAAIALGGWLYFLRREAREDDAASEEELVTR